MRQPVYSTDAYAGEHRSLVTRSEGRVGGTAEASPFIGGADSIVMGSGSVYLYIGCDSIATGTDPLTSETDARTTIADSFNIAGSAFLYYRSLFLHYGSRILHHRNWLLQQTPIHFLPRVTGVDLIFEKGNSISIFTGARGFLSRPHFLGVAGASAERQFLLG